MPIANAKDATDTGSKEESQPMMLRIRRIIEPKIPAPYPIDANANANANDATDTGSKEESLTKRPRIIPKATSMPGSGDPCADAYGADADAQANTAQASGTDSDAQANTAKASGADADAQAKTAKVSDADAFSCDSCNHNREPVQRRTVTMQEAIDAGVFPPPPDRGSLTAFYANRAIVHPNVNYYG